MNNNVDIFVTAFKPFKLSVSNTIYKLLVGNHQLANNSNLEMVSCKLDTELDDRFYSEIYMYKWLRDNYKLKKYIGTCHYRKYFGFLDNIPDMDKTFEDCDVVILKPLVFKITNKEQYALYHNIEDLGIVESIIKDKFLDYYEAFEKTLSAKILIPYNMFIMKSEDFIKYVDFVWGVLEELLKVIGTDINKRIEENKDKYLKSFSPNNTVEYQYRIGGYIGERLTNVFILKHFKKATMYPVNITENKYNLKNNTI